ncbi:hypothetical protein H311_02901 [Anncaliia algerae PRA109]|nr:hypothetical protein H311_02901 [Anncaliia algerae PRA109]
MLFLNTFIYFILKMNADIIDIDCLAIVDESGEVLLQSNYTRGISKQICKKAVCDYAEISIIDEKLVLTKRLDEVYLVLFADQERNELLLNHYLQVFSEALFKLIKKTTREYIFKKYDLICLLLGIFLHNGIVLEDNVDTLVHKVPIRSFEGLESMYIPQSFANFFSTAKSTIKKGKK